MICALPADDLARVERAEERDGVDCHRGRDQHPLPWEELKKDQDSRLLKMK